MQTTDMTLESLVGTLEIQKVQKADYVVDAAKAIAMSDNGLISLLNSRGQIYTPNSVFHKGMADKLNIPFGYYNRMQSQAPEILAQNVNGWLGKRSEKQGMLVRTFESNGGNIARALLSDRYSLLDNYDVLLAALQAIHDTGIHVEVKEATVTDSKLYINVVAPEIEVNAYRMLQNYLRDGGGTNYGIISGLTITNSEVGMGAFEIRPRAYIIRCKNGMIVKDDNFRRQHLGAQLEKGVVNWSEQTKQKNYELVISQTKDAVNQFLSKDYLTGIIQKIEVASGQKLENPVEACKLVTQELSQKLTITDSQKANILNHFIRSGDLQASGVFHALTMEAQAMDMDNRYALETEAFTMLPRIHTFDRPLSVN